MASNNPSAVITASYRPRTSNVLFHSGSLGSQKLARTFAAQVEALKRRGDQTVRVEHVTVNEGGQAIVGNVNHGGGAPPTP